MDVDPTVTLAEAGVDVPPLPKHVMLYVVVVAGVTFTDPEVLGAKVVNPVPVHSVEFVLLHESVDDCPAVMDVGFAASVAVGAAVSVFGVTPTSVYCLPVVKSDTT